MKRPLVLCFGGAAGERLLRVDSERFRIGSKHLIGPVQLSFGGAGLVHASRLLAAGFDVYPILPLAADDLGRLICNMLRTVETASLGQIADVTLTMADGNARTAMSTVLSVGEARTVVSEVSDHSLEAYDRHCVTHLELIRAGAGGSLSGCIGTIGHISGWSTEAVVKTLASHGVDVFANFGSSQYALGYYHWSSLLSKFRYFQLSAAEVAVFLGRSASANPPDISEVLSLFTDKCVIAITLGRMGVIAHCPGTNDALYVPAVGLDNDEFRDTVGAGDAFLAGVAHSSAVRPIVDNDTLGSALVQGTLWAAYQCTCEGSSFPPPTLDVIDAFADAHPSGRPRIQSITLFEARRLLRIVQLATDSQ